MTLERTRSGGRVRLLVAVTLVGVFGAGTAFGWGLSRWQSQAPAARDPRPPGERPAERLARELTLDAHQQEVLRALEAKRRPALEALLRETEPRIREMRDAVENDLRPFLSAEQVQRLDALQASRPPPGHDPGRFLGRPPPPPGAPGEGAGGPP